VNPAPAFAQGSPEWLEWRRGGIGGSDAPVVMGASPYTTLTELWQIKTGLVAEDPSNWAQQRGKDLEAVARIAYTMETGLAPVPTLAVHSEHEWLRASLDGYDLDTKTPVEIKWVGRAMHNEAKEGTVPFEYWAQAQHILMVLGSKVLHYWSFDGEDGVLVPVEPDAAYQAELFEKERAFWWNVVNRTPPEIPTYQGSVEISELALLAIAAEYATLTLEAGRIERETKKLKAKLLAVCTGATNQIGPLTITRTRGRMTLDQKALEAAGVNLAPYRKRGEDYWTIAERKA
jgi:putative phage-type endonuclease